MVHKLFQRDPSHPLHNSTLHVSQLELVSLAPAKHDAPAVNDGVIPATGKITDSEEMLDDHA